MRTFYGALLLGAWITACGGDNEAAKPPQVPAVEPAKPTPPPPVETAKTEPPPAPKPTMAELQKAALKEAAAAFGARDAKRFSSAYAEDAVITVAGLNEVRGRDAITGNMQEWFETFPNIVLWFQRVWTKADVMVIEWGINGTHAGELFGVKGTQTPIGHLGLSVLWFDENGKVKTEHRYGDLGTVMTQIGATKEKPRPLPSPTASAEMIPSTEGPDEAKSLELSGLVHGALEKKAEKDFVALLSDSVAYDGIIQPVTTTKGKDETKKFFQSLTKAFPDLKFAPSGSWGIGPYAIVEYTVTGTQSGALGTLPASKRKINAHAVDIFQTKDGKLERAWTYSNSLELMAQLGLFQVPLPPSAPAKGK